MDLVTVGDWGQEKFAKGVDVKHPSTIQDGDIKNLIYGAFCSTITSALQANVGDVKRGQALLCVRGESGTTQSFVLGCVPLGLKSYSTGLVI